MSDSLFRIERIFRDALGLSVDSPTVDLIDTGALDSLALVTLLFELEREFELTIPVDVDIESLRTVERLAALVDTARAELGASS